MVRWSGGEPLDLRLNIPVCWDLINMFYGTVSWQWCMYVMTLCIYVYDLGSSVIEIIFLLLSQLILENAVSVTACQNHWWYGINRVVMIVTKVPHSTAVMERDSPLHSMPDRCWYRHQHRQIDSMTAVLITTSAPDRNTDRWWCLDHLCRMVCWTDIVVPVSTAGSSITPAVVCDHVPLDRDLMRRFSNRQHHRMVCWFGAEVTSSTAGWYADPAVMTNTSAGMQLAVSDSPSTYTNEAQNRRLSVRGGLEPTVINFL
jgi:hypothetical protein